MYSTVMPVSVLCAVFGFSTHDVGYKYIHFQQIFCFIITVFMFILSTMIATSVTLTYYRLKFVLEENTTRGILSNLDFTDKCLKSIGVKVNATKYCIICYTYISIILSSVVCIRYLLRDRLSFVNRQQELTSVYVETLYFYYGIILWFSSLAIRIYLFVILYI